MAVNETILIDAGVKVGLLKSEDLTGLKLQAKRERIRLLEAVTREGRFPETALYQALADIRGIPFLHAIQLKPDNKVLGMLSRKIRQRRLMLPIQRNDGSRLLAVCDPDDRLSLDHIQRVTGMNYHPCLTDPDALKTAIKQSLNDTQSSRQSASLTMDVAEENEPVKLLDDIMREVYLRRASDVHFEPIEGGMRIRLRVDGQMQEFQRSLNASDEEALLNRIKVLAGLDIAEQRMAQDGAMKYKIINWTIAKTDIRVATIPTRWGERCTMRILGEETGLLSLSQLGMPEKMLKEFRLAIAKPHGMILVTGPTGSGKSTTLYAAIRELDIDQLNVLTVEDPVEQSIKGISQVQVSSKVDFAQALRSFLRHDPDVILVGEIRDRETVEIGLRSAMTGHMVLSTLHTNDSVGAVTRLADIGAERFLIGSTLTGILAQRLTRRLCSHCKKKQEAGPEELKILNLPAGSRIDLYEPVGCSFCLGSGFRGRIGIFEALWINQDLRTVIAQGAGETEIHETVPAFKTLWVDCCHKIINGDVALSEVIHLKPEES